MVEDELYITRKEAIKKVEELKNSIKGSEYDSDYSQKLMENSLSNWNPCNEPNLIIDFDDIIYIVKRSLDDYYLDLYQISSLINELKVEKGEFISTEINVDIDELHHNISKDEDRFFNENILDIFNTAIAHNKIISIKVDSCILDIIEILSSVTEVRIPDDIDTIIVGANICGLAQIKYNPDLLRVGGSLYVNM